MPETKRIFTPEEIKATWKEPSFHALAEDDRIDIMSEMSPEFARLSRLDRRRITARFADQLRAGRNNPLRRPASEDLASAVSMTNPIMAAPKFGGLEQPSMPPPMDLESPLAAIPQATVQQGPPAPPPTAPAPPATPASAPPPSGFGFNPQTEPIIPATKPTGVMRNIARPGPYVTNLPPSEEEEFKRWVSANNVPFDSGPQSDYDMRGYWRALKNRDSRVAGTSPLDPPDQWKTPFNPTFSTKSIFSRGDAPTWMKDKLVDSFGRVIVNKEAEKAGAKLLAQKNVDAMKKPPAPSLAEVTPGMERLGGTPPVVQPTPGPEMPKTWDEMRTAPNVPPPNVMFDPMTGSTEPGPGSTPEQIAQFGMDDPVNVGIRSAFTGAGQMVLDAPGGLAQMTGNAVGSPTLTGIGKDMTAAGRGLSEALAPPPSMKSYDEAGNAVFADPNWWANTIGNGIGSMLPLMLAGAGAGAVIEKALQMGLIRGALAEKVIAYGPSAVSGLSEGILSGGNAYNDAKQAGKSEAEARKAFAIVASTTAATAIPAFKLGAFNERLPIGARVPAGMTGEGLQEVAQGLGENYAAGKPWESGQVENFVGGAFGGMTAAPAEIGAHMEERRNRVHPEMQRTFDDLAQENRGPEGPPPPPGAPPASEQAPQAAPPAAPTPIPASSLPQQAETAPQAPPPPPKKKNPMAKPAVAPTIEEIPADIAAKLDEEEKADAVRQAGDPAPTVESGADTLPAVPEGVRAGVPAGDEQRPLSEVQSGDGNQAGEEDQHSTISPEHYQAAVEIANSTGSVSTVKLQGALRIGIGPASRIIAELQANGVVGPKETNGVHLQLDQSSPAEVPTHPAGEQPIPVNNLPQSKAPEPATLSPPQKQEVKPIASEAKNDAMDEAKPTPAPREEVIQQPAETPAPVERDKVIPKNYEPANESVEPRPSNNYDWGKTAVHDGQEWHSNGHFAAIGPAPASWEDSSSKDLPAAPMEKILSQNPGQPVTPTRHVVDSSNKSPYRELVEFSNGTMVQPAYFDHVLSAANPDEWRSPKGEDATVFAMRDGKVVGVIQAVRIDRKIRKAYKDSPAPQPISDERIIGKEPTNVTTDSKPVGVKAANSAGPVDSEALANASAEDVQGAPGKGPTPQQRVGSTGVDERPVGGTNQRQGDESGPGEGIGDARVGAATERKGEPDDRIRAKLPDESGTGRDHRIAEGDGVGAGGAREKVRHNLDAIRLLKELESSDREATPAEKVKLAKYVGWGGLAQAFDPYNRDWRGVHEEVKGLLTPQEWESARASTPNAHYTAPAVIKGMWKALEHLGLTKGASILEPSMGAGHFFGLQPDSLLHAKRTGIELDSITGRLARQLYPDASVHVAGFEKVKLPNNHFDVAIGNVPFGDYGVYDPEFKSKPALTSRIHDYFFAKAMNKVRPGGIVAFITSHHTMDKVNSSVRKHLAGQADLIGAIRLPNTTFKGNAGTEVTTDIIFLQKRAPGQPAGGESWMGTETIIGKDDTPIAVNEYFARHPEMMLGQMALEGKMYAKGTPTLVGEFSPEAMNAAIAKMPKGIISEYERPATKDTPGKHVSTVPEAGTIKDGGYGIVDGKLVRRVGDEVKPAGLTGKNADRVRKLIPIRDSARNVLRVQLEDRADADLDRAQAELGKAYDSFVKEFGPISDKPNVRAYAEDPDLPLLLSLEDFDAEKKTAKKTPIFSERTVARYVPVSNVEGAPEALSVTLNEYGRIDWARMQELTGKDPEQLRKELGNLVYQNPDGRKWETAEEYLSGDVRKKLKDAEETARTDKSYSRNVEALKAVQPVDLTPREIDARLGSSWVPKEVITQFAREVLKANVRIGHAATIGAWTVTASSGISSIENTKVYGTNRFDGHELLDMAMNGQVPKVYDTVTVGGTKSTVLNERETVIAQEKQQQIKDRFREWVWEHPERSETLARKYNEEFNNLRLRQYDGSHLTFPGMTEVKLRPHQKNAAWRVLQSGNTLLAHVVGAGKTFAMAAAAMELRRVGLAKKPMFVVPNHLVEQWGAEFLRLYPSANVFIAGKEFFAAGKRQRAMTRIASGNFDAIIVSHKSFEKLPVSEETFTGYMQEQVDELVEAIDEMQKAEGEKGKTVKQLEKAKKNLEAKMERRANRESRDNAITFEELGVDHVFVDEAHMYKNLFYVTKMGRIAGLPNSESNRAFDMFMKTQYLTKRNNGRGVIFATGTPVANSMAELYTMQRYLQMQFLKDNNIQSFDAWAANFGEAVTGLELAPEGTGYRMNTRFAKFVNIPELMTGFRMIADVQTAEMLDLPRPKLNTGMAQSITAPETEELKALMKGLAERAAEIRTGRIDPAVDNMLKITSEGRKAALDLRVLDPTAPDHPDSKLNLAVDRIYQIWEETKKDSLTQLVFMDLSTPKAKGQPGFSAYNEMRRKLVDKGIPLKEIAFIHDAETDSGKMALFNAVNTGRVRILFGSTEKMGAGTNVQRKLVALHHMDAPWRPADIEQREGRILRQGNTNEQVDIYQYLTQGSFDAYMWQLLGNKAGFISKVMTGDLSVRSAEDVGQLVLSAEEFMALASGNPAIKEKVVVDAELRKLAAVRTDYGHQQAGMRGDLQRLPGAIEINRSKIEVLKKDIAARDAHPDEMLVGTKSFKGEGARKEFAEALDAAVRSWKNSSPGQEIGRFRGMKIVTSFPDIVTGFPNAYATGPHGSSVLGNFNIDNPAGLVQSLEFKVKNLEHSVDNLENDIATSTKRIEGLKQEVGKPFEKEARYQELLKRQKELGELLNIGKGEANAAAAPEASAVDKSSDDDEEEMGEPRRRGSEAGFLDVSFLKPLVDRLRGNPTQRQPAPIHEFPEEVEARFQAAGKSQDEPKGIMDTLKEAYEDFKALGRVYRHLSRSDFGPLVNQMVKLQKARGIASSKAMVNMSKMLHQTGKMSRPDYELLRKAVIADDLLETVDLFSEKGTPLADDHELAFGFTPKTLREEIPKLHKAAGENPAVSSALEYRGKIWDRIKDEYIEAMKDAGEDVTGKMQRKEYYRHQVLLQKRLEAMAAAGKMAVPKNRSFLKARDVENVGADYATNFIETEMKVMTQLMIDTQTAQFVAWLDGKHNILRDLKNQAKWKNVATVMPYFEEMAQQENDTRMAAGTGDRVTGDDMFRRTLNRQQAIAMDELGRLAAKNLLPDTADGKWEETISAMADAYLAKKADEENGVESYGHDSAGDVLGYAAWVMRQPEASAASRAAGGLFKGIRSKQQTIKKIAAEKFVTWEDMVPEGHRAYQMDPTKAYYSVFTIPEHLAMKAMEENAEAIGIKAEDIRKVFARGADKDPMILPEAIVKQFEEMQAGMAARRAQDNMILKASSAIMGAWKRYQLIAPHRASKYTFRNQTGDIDSMISGLPWARTIKMARELLGPAQKEVAAYFVPILTGNLHKSVLSPRLEKFTNFGPFEGLLAVQEINDPIVPNVLQEFSRWEKQEPEPSLMQRRGPMAAYRGWMRGAEVVNNWREAANRYAAYLVFLDDIEKNGGKPSSYSASLREEVDSLDTAEEKAYRMSNDLMGAYDEVSRAGQFIRRNLIPFWSYQELNFRRYARLIRNGVREGMTKEMVGKMAIGTAARAPYLAYKVASTGLKMYALWALFTMLNGLFSADDDKKLRKDIRLRPHMTFGSTADGTEVIYFPRIGNINDIQEWLDLDEMQDAVKAAWDGRKSWGGATWDILRGGPIEKMLNSTGPQIKYPIEAALNKTLYPNIDRPRAIESWPEKIAQDFGFGDLFRGATGRPNRQLSFLQRAADLAIYRSDPKESGYYDTLDLKRSWLREHGIPDNGFTSNKPTTEALRNMKKALRYGDQTAFDKYLSKYVELGGTENGMESSFKTMAPLAGLNKERQAAFIESLSAEDKSRLDLALDYYNETFRGETADKFFREYAPAK